MSAESSFTNGSSSDESAAATVYEHKLVMATQVEAHLEKGWEPVPNVEPVVTNRSAPEPFVKVFLRRAT